MSDFFESALLDERGKQQLCLDLLAEFGAKNVRHANTKGEIIHSCVLPFGKHRNGDASPSASINFKKLCYRCLGCGSGGGLLWFIAVCRGEDGAQARQWLEGQTGLGGAVMDLSALLAAIDEMYAKTSVTPPPMPSYAETVLAPWDFIHPYLTDGAPEFGVPGRGIPEQTLRHFRVGYAQEYPMGYLRDAEGGPARHADGSRIPLPPQERIIIPHFWRGKLVGWQARRLNDTDEPKYKNSVDFPKDQTLYNLDQRAHTVVVESPASVLRHHHHQPGLTATFGAAVTEAQTKLLQRCRSVTLWMDNDQAGWDATEQLIERLARHVAVRAVDNPYAADAADLDDATVDELIAGALPWGLWSRPAALIALNERR